MSANLFDVVMPQMGESITQATILKWMKQPGDTVAKGEMLLEISTEKVSADIPAAIAGTLVEVLYAPDTTVDVDTVIARIAPVGVAAVVKAGVGAGAAPPAPAATPAAAEAATPAPALPAPPRGSRPTAADLLGARRAAAAGPAGGTNGHGGTNGAAQAPASPAAPTTDADIEAERAELLRRRSSPLVRNIARDLGIDLAAVPGSGAHGRVTRRDLLAFVEQRDAAPSTPPATPAAPPGAPGDASEAAREPLSLMRRKIAEHMVASKRTSPHAYTVFEFDLTRLEARRRAERDRLERERGVKLTPLSFIAAAVAETLPRFRALNASIDGGDALYHRHVNLAVAVAIDGGLIVPVIRRAEELNVLGMARALGELARRARTKQLTPADVTGGTFTITSPGQLGALMGTPIINQPQVAILHVGALARVPAVVEDADGNESIGIRTRCLMTLGLDHRLIDGWEADSFMAALRTRLEAADFRLD